MTLEAVSLWKLPSVLILMAEDASGLSVIFDLSPLRMTAIAGLLRVAGLERKACERVVELCVPPAGWFVTLATRRLTEGLPVWVLIAVAAATFSL